MPKKMVKNKIKSFFKNMFSTTKKSKSDKTNAMEKAYGKSKDTPKKVNKIAKTDTKDIKKNVKKVNNKKKIIGGGLTGAAVVAGSQLMNKASSNKPTKTPTPRPKAKAKKKFGMGMVDSMSKASVKQGPPKGPMKKKKRSNISNSSSYDPIFAQKVSKVKKKGTVTGPEYKMGGGKMKMAKYYSGGGTVYTGR